MKTIDDILNKITMYKLVAYGLSVLAAVAILLAVLGRLAFSPASMLLSLVILLTSSYVVEKLAHRVLRVPSNSESWFITGLILFFILQPATSIVSALTLLLAGCVASASKFIFSWKGKHIFNPAAAAAVFLSLVGLQPASWWVGSSALWPFTLLLGLVVVRKIRRFPMVIAFVVTSVVLQIILFSIESHPVLASMRNVLLVSPLIFLATIMLTEPATMPPRRDQQLIFAVIVAVFYVTGWKVGPIYIYPEVALLLGNIYAFIVAPKFKVGLRLQEIQKISDNVYNYVFQPQQKIAFLPGQYMEWTLANVPFNSRGNRRAFTIASSPTEGSIQVGVKFYQPSSAFKRKLKSLQVGEMMYASQLAGNFTIDGHEKEKLVFIAGGIGITPFRSMIKYIVDTQIKSDITLIYAVSDERELAYMDELKEAAAFGVRLVPISTQNKVTRAGVSPGVLDEQTIKAIVPDYKDRLFYVSGPNQMVTATKKVLQVLGVRHTNIKTDHFSGY